MLKMEEEAMPHHDTQSREARQERAGRAAQSDLRRLRNRRRVRLGRLWWHGDPFAGFPMACGLHAPGMVRQLWLRRIFPGLWRTASPYKLRARLRQQRYQVRPDRASKTGETQERRQITGEETSTANRKAGPGRKRAKKKQKGT